MAPFLKTLQHAKRHTHLAKANTYLKTILTLLNSIKIVFLCSNSTHKQNN